MNLQENINRIKSMMGIITEEENEAEVKWIKQRIVIKKPY